MFLGRFKKKMPTLVGISENRMLPQMAVLLFSMPQFLLFLSWKNKKKKLSQVVMLGKGFTLHILGLHV
jgi:hypothetical protein